MKGCVLRFFSCRAYEMKSMRRETLCSGAAIHRQEGGFRYLFRKLNIIVTVLKTLCLIRLLTSCFQELEWVVSPATRFQPCVGWESRSWVLDGEMCCMHVEPMKATFHGCHSRVQHRVKRWRWKEALWTISWLTLISYLLIFFLKLKKKKRD